jgi:hypothetical protein
MVKNQIDIAQVQWYTLAPPPPPPQWLNAVGLSIEIDTLEYQQTDKIETELKDVDRIRIRKVYACCPGWHSGGGHKSAPVSHKHMLSQPSFSSPLINEDLAAGPQLVFSLNNRVFRYQACYSLLPAKPGGQATTSLVYVNIRSLGLSP